MINYRFKGLYKTTSYTQSPAFLSFSLLIDCCMSVFSLFLSKRCISIVFKNGENLKILIEMFHQKLIISILAFLDYLKPKIFFIL